MQTAAIWSTILEGRPGNDATRRGASPMTALYRCRKTESSEGCEQIFVGIHNIATTWNPNDPCFDWKRPCFRGLTLKNRGHWGSRYSWLFGSYKHGCLFSELSLFFFFMCLEMFTEHPKKKHKNNSAEMNESHQMGCPSPRKISKSVYTLVNQHGWLENGPGLKRMFLLKMEIFHCYCWWKKSCTS